MKKETMMKILEDPQSYNANERLTAARLAITFLDLIAVDEKPLEQQYVVKLYDGFDNLWIDVCEPTTKEEAKKIWNEKTLDGTKNTKYDDIDYYKISPADTKMLHS